MNMNAARGIGIVWFPIIFVGIVIATLVMARRHSVHRHQANVDLRPRGAGYWILFMILAGLTPILGYRLFTFNPFLGMLMFVAVAFYFASGHFHRPVEHGAGVLGATVYDRSLHVERLNSLLQKALMVICMSLGFIVLAISSGEIAGGGSLPEIASEYWNRIREPKKASDSSMLWLAKLDEKADPKKNVAPPATAILFKADDNLTYQPAQAERVSFESHAHSETRDADIETLLRASQYVTLVLESRYPMMDIGDWSPTPEWTFKNLVGNNRFLTREETEVGPRYRVRMDVDLSQKNVDRVYQQFINDRSDVRTAGVLKAYIGIILIIGGAAICLRLGTGRNPQPPPEAKAVLAKEQAPRSNTPVVLSIMMATGIVAGIVIVYFLRSDSSATSRPPVPPRPIEVSERQVLLEATAPAQPAQPATPATK